MAGTAVIGIDAVKEHAAHLAAQNHQPVFVTLAELGIVGALPLGPSRAHSGPSVTRRDRYRRGRRCGDGQPRRGAGRRREPQKCDGAWHGRRLDRHTSVRNNRNCIDCAALYSVHRPVTQERASLHAHIFDRASHAFAQLRQRPRRPPPRNRWSRNTSSRASSLKVRKPLVRPWPPNQPTRRLASSLGMIQFVRAVERMAQTFHRYGLRSAPPAKCCRSHAFPSP